MSVATPKSVEIPAASVAGFWANAIGKKALMAITGIVMFGYVAVHLLGNLQIYAGPSKINEYAHMLQSNKALLWAVRITLLTAVGVHVIAGLQLWLQKQAARPVAYRDSIQLQATAASKTMIWSGAAIFFFVIYHLLHLTVGSAHPQFVPGAVYDNLIYGFRMVGASVAYLVAMIGLGFHLWHGLYSMFSSLGFNHPRFTPGLRRAAAVVGTLIALGDMSFPLAVLTGIVSK